MWITDINGVEHNPQVTRFADPAGNPLWQATCPRGYTGFTYNQEQYAAEERTDHSAAIRT